MDELLQKAVVGVIAGGIVFIVVAAIRGIAGAVSRAGIEKTRELERLGDERRAQRRDDPLD